MSIEIIQEHFSDWLSRKHNLSKRSIKNYSGAIKTITNWLNYDLSEMKELIYKK